MFDYIFNGGVFDGVKSILSANPSESGSIYSTAWTYVTTVYDTVVVPIGLCLVIVWFLVGFVQKAASEHMNFDNLFLQFVKLIAAWYLISNGMDIFCKLWGVGISLMNDLSAALKGVSKGGGDIFSADTLNSLWGELLGDDSLKYGDKGGKWACFVGMLQLMFPWIIAAIMSGCAHFIAYSRMFEMLFRVTAAPIALSDFINEGTHSGGWRYIKNFLAVAIQGFAILLIIEIYSSVAAGIITDGTFMETFVSYAVISIAAIAFMFRSQPLCKELIGVQ